MSSKKDTNLEKKQHSSLETDARNIQTSLSELLRIYQFRDKQRICYYDISVTQCYALNVLLYKGKMTLNELAAELFLNKSTASRVIDTLEEKGYVIKATDPNDARALILQISDKGKSRYGKIQEDLVVEMKNLIEDFEPGERVAAYKFISRLSASSYEKFRAK